MQRGQGAGGWCGCKPRADQAWHHKAYEREQPAADRKVYADAEEAAKVAGMGLWADAEPVPPWDFRHKK